MSGYLGPNINKSGLVFSLDAADKNSYPDYFIVYSVQCYSVFNGGLRSANYTVQYSDDNSTWTTAFTGVMSNNSSCGIITGTGVNTSNLTKHRYWRYVEGAAVAGHHPRVSRIDFITDAGITYNLITYTTDNCSDSGTYIVGTVSKDFFNTWYNVASSTPTATLISGSTFSESNRGVLSLNGSNGYITIAYNSIFNVTSTPFSVSVWHRNDNGGTGYNGIISADYTGDSTWKILKDNGEQFYKARIYQTIIAYPAYTIGRFHNYTFTKSGTNLIAYFDGIAYSSSTTSGDPISFSNNLVLGSYRLADAQGGGYLLPQTYGNVLFYNRALTGAEVLANYNATKTRFGR